MLGSARNILITYLALALAVSAVQANSDFYRVQRDHVNLKRIVKKRSPQGRNPFIPVIGAGAASAASSGSSSSSSSSSASDGLSLGGILPSNILSLSHPTYAPPPSSAPPSSKPTVTVVATNNQEAQSTEVPKPTGAAASKSTTLMVLIVIASSIGGIAILWTIFRKWKLGRSSKFDERLQPIDWQQPTEDSRDAGIIPAHRRAPSNASSFHSASAHGHANGRHSPNGGATLQPIPDHDFTAGAAPIGGYADLARGPSPPMGEVLDSSNWFSMIATVALLSPPLVILYIPSIHTFQLSPRSSSPLYLVLHLSLRLLVS
ncbi:hypothetical protein AN958_00944 [Leucoagaricus sp. SymC.cos]|nr:hypothetical protein AN958_00944 [Leucoagaricus sp. SymC.cos]